MDRKRFDALVVGLGAAGCWVAKTLTARGLRVCGLDAGPLLTPADRPTHAAPFAAWRRLLDRRRRVQSLSVSFHPRLAHLYVDDRRNPYSCAGGDRFLWIRGRQVGGRLHTWARTSLRLSDHDFARATEDGHGIPWPIRLRDLAPHYETVERFHGLQGALDGLDSLPDGVVSETHELSPRAALFRERVLRHWPSRSVIAPRLLAGGREAVPTPLESARATGLLATIPETSVARVLLNADGTHAIGVECARDGGAREIIHADLVFLCASAIETVRILLNSRCKGHEAGIGNRHDLLGRYLVDHNFVAATGRTGEDYRSLPDVAPPRDADSLDLGEKIDFYVPDFSDTLGERGFVRGFGMQGTLGADTWGIGVFGEMLPHHDNRVTVTAHLDSRGIPIANVAIRRRANERAMIRAQKAQLAAMAEAADLRIAMPFPRPVRGLLWKMVGPEVGVMHLGLAIHESGGARMGDDPKVSVLDPHNRVWEVPNLLVADGACFPSTGCQNPTLTIMALAARAAELAAASQA